MRLSDRGDGQTQERGRRGRRERNGEGGSYYEGNRREEAGKETKAVRMKR